MQSLQFLLVFGFLITSAQSWLYQNSSSSTSSSTSSPTSTATTNGSCTDCNLMADGISGHLWVQGILSYTAATAVTIIDYDTNTTSTTLIPNNVSYTIPFDGYQNTQYYGAGTVFGTVYTTKIFGSALQLTYPTPYLFINDLIVTSSTESDGSCTETIFPTSVQIVCAVTTSAPWETNYLGSLDDVPTFCYSSQSGISTCSPGTAAGVPTAKAAVTALTGSSTRVIGTPPTPKPKAPVPVPAPVPANPGPANPAPANPQPANPQPANPQPANPQPANPQPANPQPANPAPAPNPSPNPAPASPQAAPNPTLNPAPTQNQPASSPQALPQNPPASPNTSASPQNPTAPGSPVSSGGPTAPAQTPHIIIIPPPITFGTQVVTANSVSQYLVNSQTLLPGGPPITISSTAISLATSASALIIGGSSTVPLTPVPVPSAATVLTLGGQTYTANPSGAFVVGGSQTLVPGSSAVTVAGSAVSIAPGGTEAVVGGSTELISTVTGLGPYIISGLGGTATTVGYTGPMYTGTESPGGNYSGPLFTGGAGSFSSSTSGWLARVIGSIACFAMI